MWCPKSIAVWAAFAASSLVHAFTPTEDGLFAVFDTSMGEFTAKLFYEATPQTVASLVGLAEGTQAWADRETGAIRKGSPFYDGIIFHRVIAGFVIQGGSPNQAGTDGPGYEFFDEIVPNDPVFTHDRAGVLSMANNGQGNTNGAQFFVTLDSSPNLDGKHTVFGEIVEGLDVVQSIGAVATDDNDRPVEDVVIHSLSIVREGAAAVAFDAGAHGLPTLQTPEPNLEVTTSGEGFNILADLNRRSFYTFFSGSDLASWSLLGVIPPNVNDLGPSLIFSSPLSDLGGDGVEFWQAIEAAYPPLTDRAGTTINVDGSLVAATSFDIDLAADFGGTITIVGGDSFPIFYYRWHDFGDLVNLTIFANGLLKLQFYFPRGGGEGLLWVGPNQSQEAFTESGQTVTVTPPAP